MRGKKEEGFNEAERVEKPVYPIPNDEMFDDTTAASIVSALRRWSGSPVVSESSTFGDLPDAFQSIVRRGLRWSQALRGLTTSSPVDLADKLENLSEILHGARVVFEPVSAGTPAGLRPSIDIRELASEARGNFTGAHNLSTPLSALKPEVGSLQTVVRLSEKDIFDGCTLPVRSLATDRLYGYLHVGWDRRPRANADEMRWCLLAVAQLVADACVADDVTRQQEETSELFLAELKASQDACLLVHDDVIVFANDAALRMLETTERRLRRARVQDLLQPLDRNTGAGERKRRGADRRSVSLTLPDGSSRLVECVDRRIVSNHEEKRLIRIFESDTVQRARHRALIESLSEAVWQVEMRAPLSVEKLGVETLSEALRASTLTDCNGRMAELVTATVPAAGGAPESGDILAVVGVGLLKDFLRGGFRLRRKEHRVRVLDGSFRHFLASIHGVRRDGRLTHVIGTLLETTANVEAEQQTVSALEKQREELGRELHDVVGQLLTGIRLLSSNLARDTTLPPEKVRLHATRVSQMAEEAHLNLRQINRGLSASHLQHVRLDDALHDLAEFVGTMPTVQCAFECDEEIEELQAEKKLQVYRIAQEAVNNALKHAGATRISITWLRETGGVCLCVSDNGRGFDETEIDRKTLGLHSMRYRARVVGATFDIQSQPGTGTTVKCVLPT